LRALMRRSYSIHQMLGHLERRAAEASMVRPVMERLKQRQYLDDARYARDFARSHAQLRRQGRFRIARELRSRGVPDHFIEPAMEEAFAETNEAAILRVRLKRRLSRMSGELDQRKLASLYRNLMAAGFSGDLIRSELRAIAEESVPEFPETSEEDA
jgi:regulatory protein